MHGAAGVHPQTVGHARATVAGAGVPTVVGRPRVVACRETAGEGADKFTILLNMKVLHTQRHAKGKT